MSGVMALFMDSDFSLLKPNQQKDMVDFKVLFGEQDHCKGELNLKEIITQFIILVHFHVVFLILFKKQQQM